MFSLKEVVRNKDKREEFVKEFKELILFKEESKLLYRSHKINDIENLLNLIGINFYVLVIYDILEERIPSQKKLPEMKYLKKLDCNNTNIEKISDLENLKVLYCHNTNVKEISYLKNLEYLDCRRTNIKEIPYMPNLKEVYPKDIKMRNK